MPAPGIISSSIALDISARGNGNPRNSEGDFIRLRDNRIMFAYSRYNGESSHDSASCDIAAVYSCDGGKTFSDSARLLVKASEHNVSNIMSVSLMRMADGALGLFYLCKYGPFSCYYLRRSYDEGETFGKEVKCIPDSFESYYVVNNCRVFKSASGKLLVPVARHNVHPDGSAEYYGCCYIYESADDGETWHDSGALFRLPERIQSSTGLQEPGLYERADGSLVCYFRTDKMYQYQCIQSADGQWGEVLPSRFTSPDSPMLIVRNPYNSVYYAVWNPIPNYNGRISKTERWVNAGRTPFVLAESEDGAEFGDYTVIENDPEHGYCYPAIMFTDEKTMLLAYCSGGPEDGMCLTKTKIRRLTLD